MQDFHLKEGTVGQVEGSGHLASDPSQTRCGKHHHCDHRLARRANKFTFFPNTLS